MFNFFKKKKSETTPDSSTTLDQIIGGEIQGDQRRFKHEVQHGLKTA
jgi:hypothetical protein